MCSTQFHRHLIAAVVVCLGILYTAKAMNIVHRFREPMPTPKPELPKCPAMWTEVGPQHRKGRLDIDVGRVFPKNEWKVYLTFDKIVNQLSVNNGRNEKCNGKVCSFENENHNKEITEPLDLEMHISNSDWDNGRNFDNHANLLSVNITGYVMDDENNLVMYELCEQDNDVTVTTTKAPMPTCDQFYQVTEDHSNGKDCSHGYKGDLFITYSKDIADFRFKVVMTNRANHLKIYGGKVKDDGRNFRKVFAFDSISANGAKIIGGQKLKFPIQVDWNMFCKKQWTVPKKIVVSRLDDTEKEVICRG